MRPEGISKNVFGGYTRVSTKVKWISRAERANPIFAV